MIVKSVSRFEKNYKKLQPNQRTDVNAAIRFVMENPTAGQRKKGDLSDVRVYKFKCVNQLTLPAYVVSDDCLILTLLEVGSHENFYRDLKHK